MKFSSPSVLFACIISVAIAAPAVITVTEQVSELAVTVEAIVLVENDQTVTSYTTLGQEASPTTSIAMTASDEVHDITTVSSSSSVAAIDSETNVATTTTSSGSATATSSDYATALLVEHNNKRALHQNTSALTWDDTLASYAQSLADAYDCSGTLTEDDSSYGENLALGYGITGAVDAWYDEISEYDFSSPGYSSSTGHFTQVVWKSTTSVGCGIKYCDTTWGEYVVCSYNPAGNVIGEFSENVMPLTS
ncbi:hypothetical protein KAFR_0A03570 [Kazachstania africana CBS 2517]|uniref:SCP domain-containing protein n=1 Tax=Kazachstania africana (strain ATCC 22294 / BCRC 22015 / CBS 2517 / CECT 1963 / NBRC 1671 / NRRL Y-8276) TaxID=1071382 RepID=H2AN42_KAZAF|nr:hypothetical protein KAFR_0A03570 [Kazachstania africana CBS 2517]CCF55792.1 hypothetical protein KAFR_0A03570 [Kazachstania africana CBS 2517]